MKKRLNEDFGKRDRGGETFDKYVSVWQRHPTPEKSTIYFRILGKFEVPSEVGFDMLTALIKITEIWFSGCKVKMLPPLSYQETLDTYEHRHDGPLGVTQLSTESINFSMEKQVEQLPKDLFVVVHLTTCFDLSSGPKWGKQTSK